MFGCVLAGYRSPLNQLHRAFITIFLILNFRKTNDVAKNIVLWMFKQSLEKLHTLHLTPGLLCRKKSHGDLVHEGSHCRLGPCKVLAFDLISVFPLYLLFVGTLLKVN